MAACGIAPEDDDANAASKTRPTPVPRNGGTSIPTGKDGSVTATLNPPAGEVLVAPTPERVAEVEKIIRACKSIVNLQVEWQGLTKEEQAACVKVKDEVKAVLLANQPKPESKE